MNFFEMGIKTFSIMTSPKYSIFAINITNNNIQYNDWDGIKLENFCNNSYIFNNSVYDNPDARLYACYD